MSSNAILSNRRALRWHIAFGDQSMFFTREPFDLSGGFPDLPIMEDYELSRRMKQRKIPLTVLPRRITATACRYEGRPILFTMGKMFHLRCLDRRGHDISDLARRYRDRR